MKWELALHNPNAVDCSGANVVKLYLYTPADGVQVTATTDFWGYHVNSGDRLIKTSGLPSGITWNASDNCFDIVIDAGTTKFIKSSDILQAFTYPQTGDPNWSGIHLALEAECALELDTMLSGDVLYRARKSSSSSLPLYNANDEHSCFQYWGIWNGEYAATGDYELVLPHFRSTTGSATEDGSATVIYIHNPTDTAKRLAFELYVEGYGYRYVTTRWDCSIWIGPHEVYQVMPSQMFINYPYPRPTEGTGHFKIYDPVDNQDLSDITAVAQKLKYPDTTCTMDGKKTKQTTMDVVPLHIVPVSSGATN